MMGYVPGLWRDFGVTVAGLAGAVPDQGARLIRGPGCADAVRLRVQPWWHASRVVSVRSELG
jgi:hypothetical protein